MILCASPASALQILCGAAPCTDIGAATVTSITFSTNAEFITNGTNGIILFNRNDTGDANIGIRDGDAAPGTTTSIITSACSDVTGTAEFCDMTLSTLVNGSFSSFLSSAAGGDGVMTTQKWKITINNGAAPAATCVVGEIFIDLDETDDTNCATTADNSLCLCIATNTWAALENN